MEIKEKLLAELNNRKSYTESEIETEREESGDYRKTTTGYLCEIAELRGKLQAINEIIDFVEGLWTTNGTLARLTAHLSRMT